ncbi:MAG: hypothetical protein Q8O13_11235 [Candidatus Omnitrophota bacterium]|nr:hypothetical protein [Candidatus Omnitrophota bacterium]
MFLKFQHFKKGRVSGQVAIFIILIIAIIFLFVAVLMNVGQVALNKTIVTIAADSGAITLASYIGSSARFNKYSSMGGAREICFYTGFFAGLLKFLAVIVALITMNPASLFWTIVAYAGVALSGIAMILGTRVNHGQVQAFNKEQEKLSKEQQFQERAIQAALFLAVTDNKQITDDQPGRQDQDMDGLINDEVSYFGDWYLKQRLQGLVRDEEVAAAINTFLDVLRSTDDYLGFADYLYKRDPGGVHFPLCNPEDPVNWNPTGYECGVYFWMGSDEGSRPVTDKLMMFPNFYDLEQNVPSAPIVDGWPIDNIGNFDLRFWLPGTTIDPPNPGEDAQVCGRGREGDPGCPHCYLGCNILTRQPPDDAVDHLKGSINAFQRLAKGYCWQEGDKTQCAPGILQLSLNTLIQQFPNGWFKQFYNPETNADWFDRLQEWQNDIIAWSEELGVIRNTLNIQIRQHQQTLQGIVDPILRQPYLDRIEELSILAGKVEAVLGMFGMLGGPVFGFVQRITLLRNAIEALSIVEPIVRTSIEAGNKAVYGWDDNPEDDNLGCHVVKVEAEMPLELPLIYLDEGTFRDCYKRLNETGRVKVTVTRFDQSKSEMRFALGIPIWKFNFSNPWKPGTFQGNCTNESEWERALPYGVSSSACACYGPEPANMMFIGCDAECPF